MTHAIWDDLRIRLHNLRGDMVGQWQGDLDNVAIERTIMGLGAALQLWALAEPPPPVPPITSPPSPLEPRV